MWVELVMSSTDWMSLPFWTIRDWSALKYGSEKVTFCERAGVIVADEATMSNLPACWSEKIVPNEVSSQCVFNPSLPAIASTRSTSKPV